MEKIPMTDSEKCADNLGLLVCLCFTACVLVFVGLTHTQYSDLVGCPANYRSGMIALVVIHILVMLVAVCMLAFMASNRKLRILVGAIILVLILIFSIADTATTAIAWNSPNCTASVQGSDSGPILMIGFWMFVSADWLAFVVAGCCIGYISIRSSDEITPLE